MTLLQLDITYPELFNIVRRVQVVPGGIEGYVVPKQYVSPKKKIPAISNHQEDDDEEEDRSHFKNLGREFYLDQHTKQSALIPGPAQYKCNHPLKWAISADEMEKMDKKLNALSYHHDRRTIFEDIQRNEARNGSQKKPLKHMNTNAVFSSLAEKKKQRQAAFFKQELLRERKTQFDDTQYLAQSTPGPGHYSPHYDITKIIVDKKDHNYWKEKHASPSPSAGRVVTLPGVGSYHPLPADYKTFGQIQLENDKDNNSASKKLVKTPQPGEPFTHPGFGTERRTSLSPKKISKTPGPGSHNLAETWENKKHLDSMHLKSLPRGSNPLKHITKGIEHSIYHEKLPKIS